MNQILVDDIELSHFKCMDHVKIPLEFGVNVIVGRNGEGKSTILNSIAYALTGYDMFGAKLDPFNRSGDPCAWVLLNGEADRTPLTLRRIAQKKGKKTENIVSGDISLDKEVFLSLSNPRYILQLDPKGIKSVLASILKMDADDMVDLIPAAKKTVSDVFDGTDSVTYINSVEKAIKDNTALVKKTEDSILIHKGKISGTENINEIFAENGIVPNEEIAEAIAMTASAARSMIDVLEIEVEKQKLRGKNLNAYRSACYEVIAKKFNDSLTHVNIELEKDGKDVFIVKYDGKDVRACSNSEQLRAGLEIVDTLSAISGLSYPCMVDNAECALNVDTTKYPNIKQFIFTIVADEELSTWDGEDLREIHSGVVMPRTAEDLQPSVKILDGWGTKSA